MNISELETRVDELVALSIDLAQKNAAIEAERIQWQAERRQLIAKNDQARARLEALIRRLKSMG